MFVGEQPDGSVAEIEQRDVDFLEKDFPTRGEVRRDVEFCGKRMHQVVQLRMGKKFSYLLGIAGATYLIMDWIY